MKALKLTYDELDSLHQLTECSFFKHDEETGKVSLDAVQKNSEGSYVYGVDKLKDHFPDIDISGLDQIDYVSKVIEEG